MQMESWVSQIIIFIFQKGYISIWPITIFEPSSKVNQFQELLKWATHFIVQVVLQKWSLHNQS